MPIVQKKLFYKKLNYIFYKKSKNCLLRSFLVILRTKRITKLEKKESKSSDNTYVYTYVYDMNNIKTIEIMYNNLRIVYKRVSYVLLLYNIKILINVANYVTKILQHIKYYIQ